MEDESKTEKQLVNELETLRRKNKLLTELTECAVELIDHPPPDLDDGLEILVLLAGRLLNTSHGFISRVSDVSEFKAGRGIFSQECDDIELLVQSIQESDSSALIDDYNAWRKLSSLPDNSIIGTVIVVPIKHRDQLIGVIGLAHDIESGRTFNSYELEILARFANLASSAMYLTAQFESSRQRFVREVILSTIRAKIFDSSVLDIDVLNMLEILCQELVQVLDADSCRIALLDSTCISLTVVSEHYSKSVENSTIGDKLLMTDNPLFEQALEKGFAPRWQEVSYVVIRFVDNNGAIAGITILDKTDHSQKFTIDEIEFAAIIIEEITRRVSKAQYHRVREYLDA